MKQVLIFVYYDVCIVQLTVLIEPVARKRDRLATERSIEGLKSVRNKKVLVGFPGFSDGKVPDMH